MSETQVAALLRVQKYRALVRDRSFANRVINLSLYKPRPPAHAEGGSVVTLSQRLRPVTKRINWLGPNVWSSWDGAHECVFVRLTAAYIHFALGFHPDHQPVATYSLDRQSWDNNDAAGHSRMVENETCFCRRKVGDKLDHWAACIEHAIARGQEARAEGGAPVSMSRTPNEAVAREIAAESGLTHGFCIFDGWYYVGTEAQLRKLSRTPIGLPPDWPDGEQREVEADLAAGLDRPCHL